MIVHIYIGCRDTVGVQRWLQGVQHVGFTTQFNNTAVWGAAHHHSSEERQRERARAKTIDKRIRSIYIFRLSILLNRS